VILSCPTCATRYRHEALPVGSPARCGQCDRVFPVPPSRSYFVEAVAPAGHRLVAAAAGGVSLAHPLAVERPAAPAPVLPRRVPLPAPNDTVARDEASLDPLGLRLSGTDRDLVQGGFASHGPVERRNPPAEPRPASANALVSVATAILVGAAAGAFAGIVLQLVLGGPWRAWLTAGATCGVLAAWGWRRWTSARS
jgi:hypothetical protein